MLESRVVIGDFRTGRNILDLETINDTWYSPRNAADRLSCTIDLADRSMRKLDLRNAATAGKTYLAKLIGDHVMAFGLIGRPRYNKARRELELRAVGIEEYFRRRTVLPEAALTNPLIDPATGEPNAVTNTVLSGWDMGTILKKIVQQALAWNGGNLPIVFEADRVGTHEETILGSSLTRITTVLENYAVRDNGPDWEFAPRLTSDRQGIELLFRTGTEAQPRLQSETVHLFDYAVPEPGVDDLVAEVNADDLTSLVWTPGGRATGEALVAFSRNTALRDAGYPMLEAVDNTHLSASDTSTLQDWADEWIRLHATPTETWPFRVRTDISPAPGEYNRGDLIDIEVQNDAYYPDGTYRRRIYALSGDENPNWITIQTQEAPLG